MGVILWHQVEFPDQHLTVSSDVYSGDYIADANVSITYAMGQPGSFSVALSGLPQDLIQSIGDGLNSSDVGPTGGVPIRVKLGYLEDVGPTGGALADLVLDGVIETLEASAMARVQTAQFKGKEKASYRLTHTNNIYSENPPPRVPYVKGDSNSTPLQLVNKILSAAQSSLRGDIGGINDSQTFTLESSDGFALLDALAQRYGAEVLAQDGAVQFGKAVVYPPGAGVSGAPDPTALANAMGGEDAMVTLDGSQVCRMAVFRPFLLGARHRFTSDLPDPGTTEAFEFTVLGAPKLRAGAKVLANIVGFDKPSKPFRVLNVTHSYSVGGGYICSGRAVAFKEGEGNRQQSDLARTASATAVADQINSKIKVAGQSYPSIDVGKVKAGKATDRLASLLYLQKLDYSVASPSVDLDIDATSPVLVDKPVLSPFAFQKTGLSVPIYPGMRALMTHVRDAREDTIVAGFVWANKPKMDRPKANAGDWWLCLPTSLDGQGLPKDKGVSDLISADGRRVIETVGLRVVVGQTSCSNVGERPTEGNADELVIEHKSGTKVTIASSGEVKVETSKQSVTLTDGTVTLKVGGNKVSIS